jgi:hypothetical protein
MSTEVGAQEHKQKEEEKVVLIAYLWAPFLNKIKDFI